MEASLQTHKMSTLPGFFLDCLLMVLNLVAPINPLRSWEKKKKNTDRTEKKILFGEKAKEEKKQTADIPDYLNLKSTIN